MEQLPKKRGRPSKKEEKVEIVDSEPKKRGRKPKVVDGLKIETVSEGVIKKRGRKPKDKLIDNVESNNNVNEMNENNEDNINNKMNVFENIILHIPYCIDKTDEDNFFNSIFNDKNLENDLMNYKPNMNIPEPVESNIFNNNEILNFEKLPNTEVEYKMEKQKIDFDKINNNSDVKIQIDELKDMMDKKNEDLSLKDNRKTLTYMFNQLCKNEKFGTYPDKTDICCWWCCHNFKTIPISLPYKYDSERFHGHGIFCSFNCAASHNFNNINDHNNYERYSLLNLLHQKITGNKSPNKIPLAPPKELLKVFGGYLSIDEYRKNNLTNEKSYKLVMPPIISIMPQVEENINYITSSKNDYRLKRKKPIVSKSNMLETFVAPN
jgi:hypothetical protein